MLSEKQLENVCLLNCKTYEKCRYLKQDENDYTKFYCQKLMAEGRQLDKDLETFVELTTKFGKDPRKDNVPMGDNCSGYPVLKHIKQGYDCD